MIPALLVWVIVLTNAYLDEPFEQKTTVIWADRSGSWPMRVRCLSTSGCFISNYMSNVSILPCVEEQLANIPLTESTYLCQFDATGKCDSAYPSAGNCVVLEDNQEAEMRWDGYKRLYRHMCHVWNVT